MTWGIGGPISSKIKDAKRLPLHVSRQTVGTNGDLSAFLIRIMVAAAPAG